MEEWGYLADGQTGVKSHCERAKRPKQSSGLREHAAGLPRALRALGMTPEPCYPSFFLAVGGRRPLSRR